MNIFDFGQNIDYSKIGNSPIFLNLGNFQNDWANYQKINDPKGYEESKNSAIDEAKSIAQRTGWAVGSLTGINDQEVIKNYQDLLKSSYDKLLAYGVSQQEANDLTFNSATNQIAQNYARVKSVEETNSASDALKSFAPIALSIVLPGASAAIGSALGASGAAATVLGNAVIGGAMAEASGGDFLQGALTSGAGAALGAVASPISSAVSEAVGSNALGQALTSGALAEATGGDFLQGAVQGGLSGAISDAKLAAAEDYINSIAPGTSYEADLPTSQDVFDVIAAEQPSYQVSDTTFTPDYSLSIGAPVVQDMGAQGIQVPTINEVIDVVNQPVDYSLPVPSTNVELVMPTTPNIDAMGGGQGITVPVSGGTLTESGVIPVNYVPILGDEQSFINQPAPNAEIVIPEAQAPAPKDIGTELAVLDVVKAVAPYIVTAALANEVVNNQQEETQTGFPIVPVPSDWRSPEYNMAFTPSAPIDFGTRELLRGTQFENPQITAPNAYSLSNLINTLNMGSVPFVQQNYEFNPAPLGVPDILQQFNVAPTVGMTDIIGNLNNQPVSISDIIAGIQSGQNYGS